MTGTYHEFVSYSPVHDCEVCRLSVFDSRGGEFYVIIPRENGRRWRERRAKALDDIDYAIARGMEPGQVIVKEPNGDW